MKTLITLSLAAALAVVASQADAAVLTMKPGKAKVDTVTVAESAEAQIEGRTTKLEIVGAGLRKKTVFAVRVYVGQVLTTDARAFVRNEKDALASTDKMQAVAMHFTFLRNVGAEEVMNALKESLDANEINVDLPEIKAFLDAIKNAGDMADGKTLALIGERLEAGKEVITIVGTNGEGKTIKGGAGFVRAILSMWLGETTDSHLANFKKAVIEGNL